MFKKAEAEGVHDSTNSVTISIGVLINSANDGLDSCSHHTLRDGAIVTRVLDDEPIQAMAKTTFSEMLVGHDVLLNLSPLTLVQEAACRALACVSNLIWLNSITLRILSIKPQIAQDHINGFVAHNG